MRPDEDDPLAGLDARIDIVNEAHFSIYTQHRALVDRELANERTRALLDESRRIALDEAPAIVRRVRDVALERGAQRLLDPSSSGEDVALDEAILRAEEAVNALLRQQQEIARELDARRRPRGGG